MKLSVMPKLAAPMRKPPLLALALAVALPACAHTDHCPVNDTGGYERCQKEKKS